MAEQPADARRWAVTDFQESAAGLASSPPAQNLKFEREDWSLFRTVEGLQQRAGVRKERLRRLVLKELADNGLDNGANVQIGTLDGGGYFVEDDGSGIEPEEVASLFSISRPMVSTKLLRLPSRGALGNGLRVVAGAVLASEGSLTVITRNERIELRPERDGTTTMLGTTPTDFLIGTRIEISFGSSLPADPNALSWARTAIRLGCIGQAYSGKSSPWWYDPPQFRELLYASGATPVRELIANLDGCTGAKAGEIVAEAGLGRALCEDVTNGQAERLLRIARANAREVKPSRLGAIGPEAYPGWAYASASGTAEIAPTVSIPYVIEGWAVAADKTTLQACVNRTAVTGDIRAARDKRDIDIFGCGLHHRVTQAPKDAQFDIILNITTPFMPITSDGKAPNMVPFLDGIMSAVASAVRKAHRPNAGNRKTQKDIVLDNLDDAIAEVSNDGEFRFNERQILYRLRPIVREETGKELTTANFKGIITDYEAEHGEIPLMYREPRGSIYHPHKQETITLGTLMVENYKRPPWQYNKVVYIEKEGFAEALKAVRWAERHDCMLASSKGFTTRAIRDLVDKLAEHDEPVTVFCVHDADAYGTMIFQTFQEATRARGARKIKIINLGLEPWEALEMGLEVEGVEEKDRRKAVANYVLDHEGEWEEWLQTRRVELNAMTTPQFIEWLDSQMEAHDTSKLIPPADVLEDELAGRIEAKVRADITERILREAGLDDQVAEAIAEIEKPTAATLEQGIRRLFKREPDREWRDHIEVVAQKMARGRAS
jgi:Topoisomerase 6 subunit A/Spo11, Toprim domain